MKLYTVKIFEDGVVHWTGDVFADNNIEAERVALMKATVAEIGRHFAATGEIRIDPLPFSPDVQIAARSWQQ